MKRILVLLLFASPLFAQNTIPIIVMPAEGPWTAQTLVGERLNAPVTFGVGIPDAWNIDCPGTQLQPQNEQAPTKLILKYAGTQVTSQFRCMAHWPSGNAEWVLVDAQLPCFSEVGNGSCAATSSLAGNINYDLNLSVVTAPVNTGGNVYCVTPGSCTTSFTPMAVDSNPGSPNTGTITVSTGAATFIIQKANFDGYHDAAIGSLHEISGTNHGPYDGFTLLGPSDSLIPPTASIPTIAGVSCGPGPVPTNYTGASCTTPYSSQNDSASTAIIEENGPLRSVITANFDFKNSSGHAYFHGRARMFFWANRTDSKTELINENAYVPVGGCSPGGIASSSCSPTDQWNVAYKEFTQEEMRETDNLSGATRDFNFSNDATGTTISTTSGTMTSAQSAYLFQGYSDDGEWFDWGGGTLCPSQGNSCVVSYVNRSGTSNNWQYALPGYQITALGTGVKQAAFSLYPVGWSDFDDTSNGIETGIYQMSMYWPKSLEYQAGNTSAGCGGVSPFCGNNNEIRVGIWPNQQLWNTSGTPYVINPSYVTSQSTGPCKVSLPCQPQISYVMPWSQVQIHDIYWNFHTGTQSSAVAQANFLYFQHYLVAKPQVATYWNSVVDATYSTPALWYNIPDPVQEDTFYKAAGSTVCLNAIGQCLGDVGATGFAYTGGTNQMTIWRYFGWVAGGGSQGNQYDQRNSFLIEWLQRGCAVSGSLCGASSTLGSLPGRLIWVAHFIRMQTEKSLPRSNTVNKSGPNAGFRQMCTSDPQCNSAGLNFLSWGDPKSASLPSNWNGGMQNLADDDDYQDHNVLWGQFLYYFLSGDESVREQLMEGFKDRHHNPFVAFNDLQANSAGNSAPGHGHLGAIRGEGHWYSTAARMEDFENSISDPDSDTLATILGSNFKSPAQVANASCTSAGYGSTSNTCATVLEGLLQNLAVYQALPLVNAGYPTGFTDWSSASNCYTNTPPTNGCSQGQSPTRGFPITLASGENCNYSAWKKSTVETVSPYNIAAIVDSNNNLELVQSVSGTGTTGSGTHPTWCTTPVGCTTTDNPGANQVVWQMVGPTIPPCNTASGGVGGGVGFRHLSGFMSGVNVNGTYDVWLEMRKIMGLNWHLAVGQLSGMPLTSASYNTGCGVPGSQSYIWDGCTPITNATVTEKSLLDSIYGNWLQMAQESCTNTNTLGVYTARAGCGYDQALDYINSYPGCFGGQNCGRIYPTGVSMCSIGCGGATMFPAICGISLITNSISDLNGQSIGNCQFLFESQAANNGIIGQELGSHEMKMVETAILANGGSRSTGYLLNGAIPQLLAVPGGLTLTSGTNCTAHGTYIVIGPTTTGQCTISWTTPSGLSPVNGVGYRLKYYPCQTGALTVYGNGSECPASGKTLVPTLGFRSDCIVGSGCNSQVPIGGTQPATTVNAVNNYVTSGSNIGSFVLSPASNANWNNGMDLPDCGNGTPTTGSGAYPAWVPIHASPFVAGCNPTVPSGTSYTFTGQPNTTYTFSNYAFQISTVTLQPGACSFRSAIVGTSTTDNLTAPDVVTACTLTLKNNTATSQTITSTTYTGDFGVSGSPCTGTLTTGASCSFTVAFTPTTTGARTGTVTVVTSIDTVSTTFTGTGLAAGQVCLIPPVIGAACNQAYNFNGLASVAIGVASPDSPESTTLSNGEPFSLPSLSESTTLGDFTLPSTSCGSSLATLTTCNIGVTFTPAAAGSRSANLSVSYGGGGGGGSVTASGCTPLAVQTAINSATEGQTVIIPGTVATPCAFTWTSGVTVSGKGIAIQGGGSGRIIAIDNNTEVLTIGTGTLTVNIGMYSPGFSAASITNGETLRVSETNNRGNWMQGTVTSLISGVLTMNITSTNGSGSTHRWLISTLPATIITNNSSSTLFSITEDTGFHTNLSGIQFAQGTGSGEVIQLFYASGGQAILIHDNWIQQGSGESIDSTTNRGVVWNNSFEGSTGNPGQLVTTAALRIKITSPASGQNAWTAASFWGNADTTGANNFYFETNDLHAYQAATDNDDNGRMVFRYNLVDHTEFSTHGADTSSYGQRYFEYYNNTGNYQGFSDGSTFNLANGWIGLVRGGSFVIHDNTLPAISGGTDYGTKPDVKMTVMNLQRNGGPNACWGAGGTPGQYYYAPRQIGMGRVTGTGSTHYGSVSGSTDSITYVGDLETAYIWANSRQPLTNISISDYGLGNGDSCPGSPTPDATANYINNAQTNYSNSSTAKPGYTPYTYPHPLTTGGGTITSPLAGVGAGSTVTLNCPTNSGNFASTPVGSQSSDSPTACILNNGTASGLTSIVLGFTTGVNFNDTTPPTTCGSTLAASTSCNVYVTFAPTAIGTLSDSLNATYTGGSAAQALSGQGLANPIVSLSPTSLTYSIAAGSNATQNVTLSNTGTTALTITSFVLSDNTNYSLPVSGTPCPISPSTLGVGNSCIIAVEFAPALPGTFNATLNVNDNASGSPQQVSLFGTSIGGPSTPTISIRPH